MTEQEKYVAVEFTPNDEMMQSIITAQENLDEERVETYLCEVCDAVDHLTQEQAYTAGWDYPPFIGIWGVLSPRTCPNCLIDQTAYWAVLTRGDLTERHQKTIERILAEKIVVTE